MHLDNLKIAAKTYLKFLGYAAIVAVGTIGKSPLDFSSHDWKQAANALWFSLVPVAIKALNPNDSFPAPAKK